MNTISTLIESIFVWPHNQRDRILTGEKIALSSLPEENRDRDATEPGDNVFGLRGILDEITARSIHVDYSALLDEIYTKPAKRSINRDGNPTILESVEWHTRESRLQMPSWVPDWRYRSCTRVDLTIMRSLDDSKRTYLMLPDRLRVKRELDPQKTCLPPWRPFRTSKCNLNLISDAEILS